MLYHKTFEQDSRRDWVVFVHGAGGSSAIWFKQLRAYRAHFNVLLLDLRGHGQSHPLQQVVKGHYSFRAVTEDIVQLLDHLRISSAHFVGISLGTILIRHLAELCPERVKSMVLGGAILRLDVRSRLLVQLGRVGQHILPYMWLYRLFAFIIMPRQHHQESRHLFVREARKLCQQEFKRWFRLAADVNPLMRYFKERTLPIPTLYLMGQEDHLFLAPVREQVARDPYSQLEVIDGCGHVCNVEQPARFNRQSLAFLAAHAKA
ncbi:alpha/beta fold hydrolase [Aeromonas cavernicola]|uniref:2-succinyl-6-hydroxy-2, 4-cyclohexadiene-1-carboxylate synthase n=1 Tax=Aeromonas cavernicola TaxID=1006623 RepID=A0A2H9U0Q8_9GAMM|nr:alpha/beta hydrolase [Aeromonas cavernicola]PJG57593.1 2-succinyl-6-hydroxy-2,4-cyclohexadiene-1-carboxylate synthase [Aeromonas cavernicola]